MEFVNREAELDFLNKKWSENKSQLVIVYGKRRVGKTELCIQFAKDKPHIYFLCERIAPHKQLQKFTEMLSEYFKDEFLPPEGFKDWETAFKYIANKNQKIAIIIDEFPYLVETDEAIPSTFQKIWDLYLKKSKVYLILSGSSISMMEKTVIFYRAPLYGRRTGQLLIKPFEFNQIQKVFRYKSFEEVLSIYTVAGGTPLYWNKFYHRDYLDVIKEQILTKGEPLYEEVEFLLREELKEPRNYFVILEAISLGKHKLSEIINETGFDKGIASRYLAILDSLQITAKEISVTEKIPEKSRRGLYILEDNFFNFWFSSVFRNRSFLEEGRIDEVLKKIKNSFSVLLAKNYEKVAKQIFQQAVRQEKIPLKFVAYGRWWDKNEEIDLVGINLEANTILFGEVKWSNKPVGTDIFNNLKRKSRKVEWGRKNRQEHFCLFSKSGFTKDMFRLAKDEKVYLFHKDRLIL